MSQDDSIQTDTVTAQEPESGRAELRRAAFLRAAREVFLEFGYEQANMAEIVRRAGGSLSTLYAQFGGKKGLFEAMIDSRVSELTEQMQVELAAHAPLREGLQRIGEAFLIRQTQAETLDVMRLMVAQAKKFPDVAEQWAKRAPEAVRKALAGYLEDRVKAGEIKIQNCDAAASVYFDLVRSRIQFRALMLPSYRPTEQEIHDTVERAVKVFMGGIEAL
ncbi:MAG: TetR/AcrR family transcriptional regulator [Burkholderiales bacterium]|nr:MAG: TetR/AcrR family transcriptional regulator [Burkholderiales bacterium]